MFSISAKGAYGLYALMELGVRGVGTSVQIKDIAESQGIPQHYLEQLLVTLRKAGLVKSFRGTNGGYTLAKEPAAITVAHIFTALEGPVEILREQVPKGGLEFYWTDLETQIRALLDQNLESLIMELEKNKNVFIYNI